LIGLKVPNVGQISEAPSDTVKYLADYYQLFMLSSGWKMPITDGQEL
jgi:hypothetical protein